MKNKNYILTFVIALVCVAVVVFGYKTVKKSGGTSINGHECVDLGLSVKWATCNIGASSPSDYGEYYAWGETETKQEYTVANSVTFNNQVKDYSGDPNYDVARAKWGGTWRMPTDKEILELIGKCKHEWTKNGKIYGYKITGPNGKSIFLPAGGNYNEGNLSNEGKSGGYWSSSPLSDKYFQTAANLSIDNRVFLQLGFPRNRGLNIRPVTE